MSLFLRKPFDVIRQYIALPKPIKPLLDAIKCLEAQRPCDGRKSEAIWARDVALLSLLVTTALRAGGMMRLTFNADGTGQLRRNDNGSYEIVIASKDVKTRTGMRLNDDYIWPVAEFAWKALDRYLFEYWPSLHKGKTNRVFVSSANPEMLWTGMGAHFRILVRKLIPGCVGFGPHMARHLLVMTVIKVTGSFALAAAILHDREETVRKHHGFLDRKHLHMQLKDVWRD